MSELNPRRASLSFMYGTKQDLSPEEYGAFLRRAVSAEVRALHRYRVVAILVLPFFAAFYVLALSVLGDRAPALYRSINDAIYPVTHAVTSVIPYLWSLEPSLIAHGYGYRVPAVLHIATVGVVFFLPIVGMLTQSYRYWMRNHIWALIREGSIGGTLRRTGALFGTPLLLIGCALFIFGPSINYQNIVYSGKSRSWLFLFHSDIHRHDFSAVFNIFSFYMALVLAFYLAIPLLALGEVVLKYRRFGYRTILFARFQRRRAARIKPSSD